MLSKPWGESFLGGYPLLAIAILGCGAGFLLSALFARLLKLKR